MTQIVCPHCWVTNRLAADRLNNSPICGKCKQKLFAAHPVELSSANFSGFIERNDIPVLVDFWAPWCGPCKMMTPSFEQASKTLEPHMRLAKVNIDAEQAIASRFQIQSIPTLVVFQRGKEIARKNGAMDGASIITWAKSIKS